jgi:hypothetical protein
LYSFSEALSDIDFVYLVAECGQLIAGFVANEHSHATSQDHVHLIVRFFALAEDDLAWSVAIDCHL